MGQGPRVKSRKSPSVQLDYIVHIQEVKPWRTIRSVLIEWEHVDKKSGSTNQIVPSVGDGRIEFNESFRLSVSLIREMTIKGSGFQKNCIEFNLYEPRRDKTVKGALVGTTVVDLAEYGVVKESLSISAPISCKRMYGNTAQPLLFLKIEPFDRKSLMREGSLDRSNFESVSALSECGEEADVASFTTDDDASSSHSSLAVTSAAAESNGSSSPQTEANGTVTKGRSSRSSSMDLSSDLAWISQRIGSKSFAAKEMEEQQQRCNNENRKIHANSEESFSHSSDHKIENASAHAREDPNSGRTKSTHNSLTDDETIEINQKLTKEEREKGLLPPTAGNSNVVSNIDRSKHVKSVRSSLESSKSNGSIRSNQFMVGDAKNHTQGSISNENKDVKIYTKEKRNLNCSDSKVQHLERRMEVLEGELREAAAIEVSLYSVVAEHGSSMTKVHAPARRLSRLYFHSRKGSAAKSIISGLVLVSKACGNDVPRLTFWLSNSIVLRVVMSKSFGESELPISVGPVIGKSGNRNGEKSSSPLKWESFSGKNPIQESLGDWDNPLTFLAALEKVEAWIFSRIIESIWWQTFTPHMQSSNAKGNVDQRQVNFSLELWKRAFSDACERICPLRAGGHICGCLPVLSRVIMEQLIARLDVAMFNAILRESADEIPTDPVADPISDVEVLPIPPGKASFGAGAQLKNAIGNWSRWLTDLFGIDDDDMLKDNINDNDDDDEGLSDDTSSKSFHLLNALSDLMMLPKDLLLSRTVRKEVCPTFGPPLIRRVLNSFTPDELCPDPIPAVVLEALNSEDPFDAEEDYCIMNFPCGAAPIQYQPPSTASVASLLGEIKSHDSQLRRSKSSVLKKSHTSDDELDELDSPMKCIILDSFQGSNGNGRSSNALRYQLLRDVWIDCD